MALSSAPDARLRIALFGGTYDPIHNAHLKIAREAARQQHLSRVLFIPAAKPPHKSGVTRVPYENRLRMVELACQGEPLFEASRLEAGAQNSYSIETIERVRATLGKNQDLFFLIGSDAFAEIRTWHRWQDVARAVRFLVVSRPGHVYDVPPGVRLNRLDTLDLPVSSSDVRRALAAGERPAEVPDPVLEYISRRGLYRAI